jgi:hypothetical protein
MQTVQYRCLVLAALLAASSVVLAGFDRPREPQVSRWPTADAVFQVDGWDLGPLTVESTNGISIVSRTYRRGNGTAASLAISTSPEAKRIYRAGADVPLLDNGYSVDPAPPSLVAPANGRTALLARRGDELGLLLYSYGERRGFLGNGVLGWGLAVFDAVLGQPSDYYLARISTRLDGSAPFVPPDVVALADTVFPRLAGWYAR